MSTLSELLPNRPASQNPPKGSADWVEQQNGENNVSNNSQNPPKGSIETLSKQNINEDLTKKTKNSDKSKQPEIRENGYEAALRIMNPHMERTPEQIKADEKKERRSKIIAALGDGLSALSNIFFTSQGAPDMHTNSTLSGSLQTKYEKTKKDRLKYLDMKLKAKAQDDAADRLDRSWQYQLETDAAAAKERAEEKAYRRKREKEKDAEDKRRHEDMMELQRERFAQDKKNAEDLLNERQAARAAEERRAREKDEADRYERDYRNRIAFSDAEGNEVSIHKDVFAGSSQQVFDIMRSEGIGKRPGESQTRYDYRLDKMSPQEIENFIKANWSKSTKASEAMLHLSQLTPSKMTSRIKQTMQPVEDTPVEYDYYESPDGKKSIRVPKGEAKPFGARRPNPMM